MKTLIVVSTALLSGALWAGQVAAAEKQVEATRLITDPEGYVRQPVTTTVRFNRVIPQFRAWEEEANLRRNRYIKFAATPLGEINCYVERTPENEEMLGGLRRGQELTLNGYLKKEKMEVKVKVEGAGRLRDRTHKRSLKGALAYVFIVKKIENVGSAPGRGGGGGFGRWRQPPPDVQRRPGR